MNAPCIIRWVSNISLKMALFQNNFTIQEIVPEYHSLYGVNKMLAMSFDGLSDRMEAFRLWPNPSSENNHMLKCGMFIVNI